MRMDFGMLRNKPREVTILKVMTQQAMACDRLCRVTQIREKPQATGDSAEGTCGEWVSASLGKDSIG